MTGYVQVYTGNGKGKTTAALGLALRAAGAGLKVFIGQFMKGSATGELKALQRFDDLITIEQFGRQGFVHSQPDAEDIERASRGLARAKQALLSGECDLVILDEANVAAHFRLITVAQLLELIDAKPAQVELVLTGRYAAESVIERADLVTEMCEIKHYYQQGVEARRGIES